MNNKQTGPITPAGKEASSKNAMKHGCTSLKLINIEERNRYEGIVNDLKKEYRSSNPLIQLQITRIARITIQLERVQDVTDAAFRKSRMRANTVESLLELTYKHNTQLDEIAGNLFEDKLKARAIALELISAKEIDKLRLREDFTESLPLLSKYVSNKASREQVSVKDFLLEEIASFSERHREYCKEIALFEEFKPKDKLSQEGESSHRETELSLLRLYAIWHQSILKQYFMSPEMNFTIEDTIKIEEDAMLPSPQEMDRLMRYQTTLQRQLSAAIGELLAINKTDS